MRFDTARGSPEMDENICSRSPNDDYVRYFIIYVTASSPNRRTDVPRDYLFDRFPRGTAKPDTAYGNAPEPTDCACKGGGAQG